MNIQSSKAFSVSESLDAARKYADYSTPKRRFRPIIWLQVPDNRDASRSRSQRWLTISMITCSCSAKVNAPVVEAYTNPRRDLRCPERTGNPYSPNSNRYSRAARRRAGRRGLASLRRCSNHRSSGWQKSAHIGMKTEDYRNAKNRKEWNRSVWHVRVGIHAFSSCELGIKDGATSQSYHGHLLSFKRDCKFW